MGRTPRTDVTFVKRTAMLRPDQIQAIQDLARDNEREFSAELRMMIDRDLEDTKPKKSSK